MGEKDQGMQMSSLCFSQRQQCGIWIRELSWNQPVNQPFTCWRTLGKLFNHSEHQFFKCRKMKTLISSNDYYDDSMWWLVKKIPVARFLILKTQSVTYYTGKIAWQRRSVILESLFQQFHQTLAISMATTYTTCGITHKRKFLGQVTLRDFLTASLRGKPLGESLFFIKRLEMGAHH